MAAYSLTCFLSAVPPLYVKHPRAGSLASTPPRHTPMGFHLSFHRGLNP